MATYMLANNDSGKKFNADKNYLLNYEVYTVLRE